MELHFKALIWLYNYVNLQVTDSGNRLQLCIFKPAINRWLSLLGKQLQHKQQLQH